MPFSAPEAEARAAIETGLDALRERDAERAAAFLRGAIDFTPAERFPWTALANAEILRGDRAAAVAVIDRRLAQAPRDIGALYSAACCTSRPTSRAPRSVSTGPRATRRR